MISLPASDDSGGGGVVDRVNATIAITFTSANAANATAATFSFDRLLVLIPVPSLA